MPSSSQTSAALNDDFSGIRTGSGAIAIAGIHYSTRHRETGFRLLATPTNANTNRCSCEAERLAQTINQKSLIREMESRRHVREEHEFGWLDARLGSVQNSHLFFAGACRWMAGGNQFEESI